MLSDRQRALGFVLAAGAIGLVVFALFPRWLGLAGGADVELATALKATEPEGLQVSVPGSDRKLVSERHTYSHVVLPNPANAASPQGARLVATLDLSGQWGKVHVGSLGLEEIPLVHEGGRWSPSRGWAPRLAQALATLEKRRRALASGDLAALVALVPPEQRERVRSDPVLQDLLRMRDRDYSVDAWYLRFERDEVLVSEEFRLTGVLPERPVNQHSSRRLRLIPHAEEFFFSPPLM